MYKTAQVISFDIFYRVWIKDLPFVLPFIRFMCYFSGKSSKIFFIILFYFFLESIEKLSLVTPPSNSLNLICLIFTQV